MTTNQVSRPASKNKDRGLLQQYQAIMEAAGYVIFIADSASNFTHVSAGAKALTGYLPEAMIGQNFLWLVHPDWREDVRRFYAQQRQSGDNEATFEFPILTADSEIRWLEQTVIINEDGFQSIGRDITERKQVDKALLKSESRNRALLEAIPDLMFAVTREGIYTEFHWYPELAPIIPSDQMIGENISNFGFDDTKLSEIFKYIDVAIITAVPQSFQFDLNTDGIIRAYNARVARLNDEEALFIVRDISDLIQAQEINKEHVHQLETLQEIEAELAEKLDLDYVLTMGLDSAMRLSHADAGFIALNEEDGSIRIAKLVGDYDLAKEEETLRTGRGAISRIIRARHAEMILEVNADSDYVSTRSKTQAQITIPLISQETLVGVLNLEANRADRFTAEEFDFVKLMASRIGVAVDNARLYRQVATQLMQLRDLYRQVSNLEQLKTDMIRIASHDLRNPLFVILGHLEMMRWDTKHDPVEIASIVDHTEQMEKSARTMQKIIADILSLERIEHSANEDTTIVFDLCALIAQVCFDQQPHATMLKRNLKMILPDEEIPIRGDLPQIREAVSNLVSNAIKYTRDGGDINVKVWSEGSKLVFEVEDNGIGIPEDQQDRLFQPFYRAQTQETAKIEGTGLGLHLVKNIIERHGGSMRFKSVYGEGSTFGFTMRMAPEV
ncbi:MAG: PAS domain S-box protein [Chitinophagaceae bacterium]|nr:PAS domain S-box protein [Anaerolineae bacterium]